MNIDIIVGTSIVIVGLFFIVFITIKSNLIINRLARKKSTTAREIIRDLENES